MNFAALIDGHDTNDCSGFPGSHLPWHDIGVVFQDCEDDFITWAEKTASDRLRDEIDGFGGTAEEDDFRG